MAQTTSPSSCPCKRLPQCLSSFTAAEYGDLHVLSRMGTSLTSRRDDHGYTPLHLAAQHGQVTATGLLLRLQCPVDGCERRCRSDQNHAINYAMKESEKSKLTSSSSSSATTITTLTITTTTTRCCCGATPLHRASYSGAVATMRLLLEHGSDMLATDASFGDLQTPLHKASAGGRYLAVHLLLESLKSNKWNRMLKNALVAKDAAGRTPLDIAIEMEIRQEEECVNVKRWDVVAGGPADWGKCVRLLKAAYATIDELVEARRSPVGDDMPSPPTSAQRSPEPRLFSSSRTTTCLDCQGGKDNNICLTASWEAAFGQLLRASADQFLMDSGLTLQRSNDFPNMQNIPLETITMAVEQTDFETRQQLASSSSPLGQNCSMCHKKSLVLYPNGKSKTLLCTTCRKKKRRR